MGSLLPGWDQARGVPAGFEEDYKNKPVDMNRLRSMDALRRTSMEHRSPVASPTAAYAETPGRLGRHCVELEDLHKPMTSPREEQAPGGQGAAEHDGKAVRPPHERWWKRMDSATYNEKPDEPADRDAWRHGSYVPQHQEAAPGTAEETVTLASMTPH